MSAAIGHTANQLRLSHRDRRRHRAAWIAHDHRAGQVEHRRTARRHVGGGVGDIEAGAARVEELLNLCGLGHRGRTSGRDVGGAITHRRGGRRQVGG